MEVDNVGNFIDFIPFIAEQYGVTANTEAGARAVSKSIGKSLYFSGLKMIDVLHGAKYDQIEWS
ncbi:hypothetical protein HCH_04397 [Hahella chejuensis KCTC 2396]|uniref:Uncharacterized protein n=1 Tax=Hahella chejuensis (strain KCTC 2396) TaxID=349521 RepID=Q2SE22_HAHCH|nr:hypothetical protein HCH_04397 [Hahella chejuensis KCTC 2396]